MFKRNTLTLGGALCAALVLAGCANHLPQRSEHEERIERKLLDHSLQIDVGEPRVLELPQRRIRVHEQKTFEVTAYEVTRRYDRYTPYQPWRELYEVPLGAVAIVGGVGANVTSPHKEAAFSVCTTLTARARRAGWLPTRCSIQRCRHL